jgi:preprotein translocase subunit SecA
MDAAQILDRVVARFIGTKHERDIKKMQPIVEQINAQEPEQQRLHDEQLKERFAELRTQVQEKLKDVEPADASYKDELQRARLGGDF